MRDKDAGLLLLLGGGALTAAALTSHPDGPDDDPPTPAAPARRQTALYLTDEVEVLGRVIASEIGHGTRQQKLHVAWVTRNLARQRKETIARMACQPCGRQIGSTRPVSSRLPARPDDLEIAAAVLASPQTEDPTSGATNFLNPRAMDQLGAKNYPGYEGKTYLATRDRWMNKYNLEPYYRLGKDLEIWGRRRPKNPTS